MQSWGYVLCFAHSEQLTGKKSRFGALGFLVALITGAVMALTLLVNLEICGFPKEEIPTWAPGGDLRELRWVTGLISRHSGNVQCRHILTDSSSVLPPIKLQILGIWLNYIS
jgi:hypothetical protein